MEEKKTRERNIYAKDNNIFAKKLKMALVSKDMTTKSFCEQIGVAPSNFSNKIKNNNFNEAEIRHFCEQIGFDVEITLINKETNERI